MLATLAPEKILFQKINSKKQLVEIYVDNLTGSYFILFMLIYYAQLYTRKYAKFSFQKSHLKILKVSTCVSIFLYKYLCIFYKNYTLVSFFNCFFN